MAPQPDSPGVYKNSEFLSLPSQGTSRFTTTDLKLIVSLQARSKQLSCIFTTILCNAGIKMAKQATKFLLLNLIVSKLTLLEVNCRQLFLTHPRQKLSSSHCGLFQFRTLPFGLIHASVTFQKHKKMVVDRPGGSPSHTESVSCASANSTSFHVQGAIYFGSLWLRRQSKGSWQPLTSVYEFMD